MESASLSKYRFYIKQQQREPSATRQVRDDIAIHVWRPSFKSPLRFDMGLAILVFGIFHWARLFANRDFGVLSITKEGRKIHTSIITPGYFRFPDMSPNDMQIGAVFTAPDARGQGIGGVAIQEIQRLWNLEDRRIWYIVEEDNHASIRLVERADFKLYGTGTRTRMLGLRALGQYRVKTVKQRSTI